MEGLIAIGVVLGIFLLACFFSWVFTVDRCNVCGGRLLNLHDCPEDDHYKCKRCGHKITIIDRC